MAQRRSYTMTARADAAQATGERILDAAEALFVELPFPELSLALIAERAEVTVQTVIRRFETKEKVISAAAERVLGRVTAERNQAIPGDLEDAIDNLIEHYESVGALVLRMLAQEHIPTLASIAAQGRILHRHWVDRTLGPLISTKNARDRRFRLDQLSALTDVYVWKVFRQDLQRSRVETTRLLRDALERLLDEGR
jgi:AcrR family transcriptional regulator